MNFIDSQKVIHKAKHAKLKKKNWSSMPILYQVQIVEGTPDLFKQNIKYPFTQDSTRTVSIDQS